MARDGYILYLLCLLMLTSQTQVMGFLKGGDDKDGIGSHELFSKTGFPKILTSTQVMKTQFKGEFGAVETTTTPAGDAFGETEDNILHSDITNSSRNNNEEVEANAGSKINLTKTDPESQPDSETSTAKSSGCPSLITDTNYVDILAPTNETISEAYNNSNTKNDCETPKMPSEDKTDFKKLFLDIFVERCTYFECGAYNSLCKCDPGCVLYGDCCFEYIEKLFDEKLLDDILTDKFLNNSVLLQSLIPDDFFTTEMFIRSHSECTLSEDYRNALWMISKCPKDYTDIETVHKCEEGNYYGLKSLPVEWIDAIGRVWLFRNIFCALCHGLRSDLLERWDVDFYCNQKSERESIPPGTVNLADLISICSVDFRSTVPMSKRYQRHCVESTVSNPDCQHGNATVAFRLLCESYLYTVTVSGYKYKNPHCAFCETGNTDYSSDCTYNDNANHENKYKPVDLQLMFDFNPNSGFTIHAYCKVDKTCLQFEVYDCISEKCRRLYCSENQIPHFGKCIASNDSVHADFWYEESLPGDQNNTDVCLLYIDVNVITFGLLPNSDMIIELLTNLSSVERVVRREMKQNWFHLKDEEQDQDKIDWDDKENEKAWGMTTTALTSESKEDNFETNKFRTNWEVSTKSQNSMDTPNTNGSIEDVEDISDYVEEMKTDNRSNLVENNVDSGELVKETNTGKPEILPEHVQYSLAVTVMLKRNPIFALKEFILAYKLMERSEQLASFVLDANITIQTSTDLLNLDCSDGNLTYEFNAPFLNNMSEVRITSLTNKISVDSIHWKISDYSAEKNMFDEVAVCLSRYQAPKLDCNMTAYEENEVIFKNNDIHIKGTQSFYKHSEYVKVGRKIFVCFDKLNGKDYVRFFMHNSKFQRLLSISTSSVSLLCLLVICIAHVVASKLRNNHGLNLSALSATMLLVQALILVENIPGKEVCLVFAATLHFLVLKMFIWMNIIGFDMAITFHPKTMTKSRKDVCRFAKYFAIAVALPFLCVATCLMLEFSEATLKPGYGAGDICWMTNSVSIVIFFIVPIMISVTLNLILFAFICYSIQSTKANSSVRTTSRNRTYCCIYFKMSVSLGFTWSIGIIAAFVSVNWLWYVHIVLNGLQGLSLFFCNMANARMVKLFKERTKALRLSETKLSQISKEG